MIDDFLRNVIGQDKEKVEPPATPDKWSEIIQPCTSNLIVGDVGTGKTALAVYLLDRFSQHHNLKPVVVGFPQAKRHTLPDHFSILDSCEDVTKVENAIIFIDEADLQLPIEDMKARKYVVNFLSLPRHRNQILLLAFHFPRLVLGRYLPFFATFMLKRPPYLLEFAGKSKGDTMVAMMQKAEERFAELPSPELVTRNTYVIAPRIRWQGMLENPLVDYWCDDLSKAWSGVMVEPPAIEPGQVPLVPPELTTEERLRAEFGDIGADIVAQAIHMDELYSMEQLKEMCLKRGLAVSGDKKQLATRIILDLKGDGGRTTDKNEEFSEEQLHYALSLFTSKITNDAMDALRKYTRYPKSRLQEMLQERNLSTTGLHLHLAARLAAYEQNQPKLEGN